MITESYPKDHSDDDCDVCLKTVGKQFLKKVPFIYLDRNDHVHPDAIDDPQYKDYKQYYACEACSKKGV